jgi:alkylhydroperoxidase/carboxymuconolactone decarboxylase family protein YurZ
MVKEKGIEFVREENLKYSGRISEAYELMARYQTDMMVSWTEMKKALFREPPDGALTLREKELVILAMQIATRFPNPEMHTRKAMEAGATAREIAEVAALSVLMGGMMTYVLSGQKALKAAEEYEKGQSVER